MAYMNQERKRSIETQVRVILRKYGLKGRLSVRHYSTLVLTISEGDIDFFKNESDRYRDVNTYHIGSYYSGMAQQALEELKAAMMVGNYNNSQIEYDYFEVGWYIAIHIGKWNKPYVFTGNAI